ncbi:Fe-S cluster biogenesis protein NfuA [Mesonia algae]|uniref:Fe-S cluster biogenesis protein NfuA n=1 Tax=Mesonia algae TaxID=213248 RepID=A0A2W7I4C1_9FLAO|nr:NifU family protein [Mesonia algae]PZW41676.1 Fe-S cluster biogenesis protein NfuA [Mesonia algae]
MKNYHIEVKATTNKSIVKFEADQFLVNHESYEFKNIDEASKSPLAQKLFHLPFVKTVYLAQNFVAIEKYDIVAWEDVQEELKNQLEDLLNNGTVIIKEDSQQTKKIPVTVYAESTPNPKVMKFVANKKLVLQSIEFKNIDDASHSPLAKALFHFPFVKEVFLDENYVSVSKYDVADWNDITLELREFIRSYIEDGKQILEEGATQKSSGEDIVNSSSPSIENLDDTSKEIVAILDEYIKPAVASDGGNIMFDSYDEETKTVKVILQGACSGCPSSTFTLKNGIENMLKEMLHNKVNTVEAING